MTRPTLSPALLYVPPTANTNVRFRVLTPEQHPVATTVQPALAAATALAVARHHTARYSVIAASDGRWLEVDGQGRSQLAPPDCDGHGWPATVTIILGRLAAPGSTAQGATR
jgi:hypothetical protein